MKQIEKAIMRRVYYTYALRIALHRHTLHAAALAILLFVFTSFVSVGSVLYNLSFVQVYNIDAFIYSAIIHTEMWTLVSLAAFAVLGYSFMRSLDAPRHQYLNFA